MNGIRYFIGILVFGSLVTDAAFAMQTTNCKNQVKNGATAVKKNAKAKESHQAQGNDSSDAKYAGLRFVSNDTKAIKAESARHRFDICQTKFRHGVKDDAPWIDVSMSWIDLADIHIEQGNNQQALACIEIARCFSEFGEHYRKRSHELKKTTGMTEYDFCNTLNMNKKIRIISDVKPGKTASGKANDQMFMNSDQYIAACNEALNKTANAIATVCRKFLFDPIHHAHVIKDIAAKASTMHDRDWAHFIGSMPISAIRDPGRTITGMVGFEVLCATGRVDSMLESIRLQAINAGRYAGNAKFSALLMPIATLYKKAGKKVARIVEPAAVLASGPADDGGKKPTNQSSVKDKIVGGKITREDKEHDNEEEKEDFVEVKYTEIYAALRNGEKNMQGKNLQGADFSDFILDDTDFSGADLTDVKFCRATLSKIIFNGAIINRTDFTGATVTDSTFKNTSTTQRMTWKDVKLIRATLNRVNFIDIQMGVTDFSDSTLHLVEFNKVKNIVSKESETGYIYSPCNFSGAKITRTFIKGSHFIGLNFQRTIIEDLSINDSSVKSIDFKNSTYINDLGFYRCIAQNIDMRDITANNLNFAASFLNNINFTRAKISNLHINFGECNLPQTLYASAPTVAAQNLNFSGARITGGFLLGRLQEQESKPGNTIVGKTMKVLKLCNDGRLEISRKVVTSPAEIIITGTNWSATQLTRFIISCICFDDLDALGEIAFAHGCKFSNLIEYDGE